MWFEAAAVPATVTGYESPECHCAYAWEGRAIRMSRKPGDLPCFSKRVVLGRRTPKVYFAFS